MTRTLNTGIPLGVWVIRPDRWAQGVMPAALLTEVVPNPAREEKAAYLKQVSKATRDHAELRSEVQRLISDNKGKRENIPRYANYIAAGLRGDYGEGWATPAVCLWSPDKLFVEPSSEIEGIGTITLPFGPSLVGIDGETQIAAHHRLADDPAAYGLDPETVKNNPVPFELHWNVPVADARQIFRDRNLEGVQVSKSLSLSMDQRDCATQAINRATEATKVQVDGETVEFTDYVNQTKRQLGASDKEWVTLSAARSMAVTTLLGVAGIERTSGNVYENDIPTGVEPEEAIREAANVMSMLFRRFADEFAARSAITAPAVLAGIGTVAHQAMPWSDERLTREDVVDMLIQVHWERDGRYWEGVAAKPTSSGGLSFAGGVKDSAYRVHEAIRQPSSELGRKIRGRG